MAATRYLHGIAMHHCFPPVTRPDTRLLVLGSLPGAISLQQRRYYAHPQNLFWRLMSAVIGRELVPLGYEERLQALLDAGVGLWDTVAAATREGSLDTAIRLHEASDLAALVTDLPHLRAIGFNGATSAKIGRRQLGPTPDLALIDLPSSSPAYASLSFEKKRDRWLQLAAYL
jgi:TDG/mug DNA glycosylase family protein